MSTTGALAHAYKEWEEQLDKLNTWLLQAREMRDNYTPFDPEGFQIPPDVRSLLTNIEQVIDPNSPDNFSVIPSSIREGLNERLLGRSDESSQSLHRLLQAQPLAIEDLNEEAVSVLHTILVSLDVEVSSLYQRMRRR